MHSLSARATAQRQRQTIGRNSSKTQRQPPSRRRTWNNTRCLLYFFLAAHKFGKNRSQILLSSAGWVNPALDNVSAARFS
jgi:hypothetical protein